MSYCADELSQPSEDAQFDMNRPNLDNNISAINECYPPISKEGVSQCGSYCNKGSVYKAPDNIGDSFSLTAEEIQERIYTQLRQQEAEESSSTTGAPIQPLILNTEMTNTCKDLFCEINNSETNENLEDLCASSECCRSKINNCNLTLLNNNSLRYYQNYCENRTTERPDGKYKNYDIIRIKIGRDEPTPTSPNDVSRTDADINQYFPPGSRSFRRKREAFKNLNKILIWRGQGDLGNRYTTDTDTNTIYSFIYNGTNNIWELNYNGLPGHRDVVDAALGYSIYLKEKFGSWDLVTVNENGDVVEVVQRCFNFHIGPPEPSTTSR